jgi:DNA-directed RNA polymerase specialized sigma24 family protein
VKLFFIDGYSYEQIAGLMHCEVKQVKSHLQNAKRKLQILWGVPSGAKEGS